MCDFLSLKFPLLGGILRKSTIARTMRTLGTLIASGVPILEALIIARDTSGNAVFRRAFDNIYAAIREGESMAIPLREARITDDMVVNMVDVGEETGALDTMLYKVADVYEEEVEVAVESPHQYSRTDHGGRVGSCGGGDRGRPLHAHDRID
ncbi:MAG: type II secretion system F family protein [Planctomycetaceae bacterium]